MDGTVIHKSGLITGGVSESHKKVSVWMEKDLDGNFSLQFGDHYSFNSIFFNLLFIIRVKEEFRTKSNTTQGITSQKKETSRRSNN